MTTIWKSLLGAMAVLGISSVAVHGAGQQCMNEMERKVERDHPGVQSMIPQHFEAMLNGREPLLVLDVREKAEFDVSHLPGAEHVDPDMSSADFLARFGDAIAGRLVVLYCSVGVRSSRLAGVIGEDAIRRGATGVYNLRGGIFAWHNYGQKLRTPGEARDVVHPYSRAWSSYLDFPNYARYGKDQSRWFGRSP